MATFKAVVMQHQERADGIYPVSIRITNNRSSAYIHTKMYVEKSKINRKCFEIKDQAILVWSNNQIRKYRELLYNLSIEDLQRMSAKDIKDYLLSFNTDIDFLQFCRQLRDNEPDTIRGMGAVVMAIEQMGYTKLPVRHVTNDFMDKFRDFIANRKRENGLKTGQRYANSTLNTMMGHVVAAFKLLKKRSSNGYMQPITHDISFKPFNKELIRKRTMNMDSLMKFIQFETKDKSLQLTKDLTLISFGCCGLNLKDLLLLKKSNYDPSTGRLVIQRQKTSVIGSFLIPTQTRELAEKYMNGDGDLLFDFGVYNTYKNPNSRHLASIRRICKKIGIENISMYWFRHTWSSIARNKCGATKDDVDMCLVHVGDHPMADVYIDAEWEMCDKLAQAVQDYVEKYPYSSHDE